MPLTPILAVLIVERPLCIDCLSMKSGGSQEQVAETLHRIGQSVTLHRARERCRGCGEITDTVVLNRID